jgi:post-segregation antitoxin (ccd killing protein)
MRTQTRRCPTNIRFTDELFCDLRALATTHDLTISDLVRVAVSEKLPVWKKHGEIVIGKKGRSE